MEIVTLDLDFQQIPQTVAAFLVKGPQGVLLIETGPASTHQTLLNRLSETGTSPSEIRHVLVTHIHLDHSGAAGWWSRQGAQVYVHGFGAQHLINPDRLLISAARIYGDKMDSLWGQTLPAQEERVTSLVDGQVLQLCGLEIEALDTPGHARHHMVYRIGNIAFTGDAAGIKLPTLPLVDLPAPPPEFNREEWNSTIQRLSSFEFETIYPTHFGEVKDPARHWSELRDTLHDAVDFVAQRKAEGVPRDTLVAEYQNWNTERARRVGLGEGQIRKYNTANPLHMSVDGILRYLHKRERRMAE